jgi:hypothetical protein
MIRTVSGIGHGVGYRPAERKGKDGDKRGA